MSKTKYALDQCGLYSLQTRSQAAKRLLVSEQALQGMARLQARGYRSWEDVSPKGKVRTIQDAIPPLKKVHARIANLLARVQSPDYLMCPVKGRSYITNAMRHVDAKAFHTLDVANYFPSTTDRRVYWFFNKELRCATDVAALLTSICTVQGRLPTGSPLSPLLSYFAHKDMWDEVAKACNAHSCTFSLYVDDLTLSGQKIPGELIHAVRTLIRRVGLRSNAKKERSRQNGRCEITGVIVDNGKLRVPKRHYKKLHERTLELALPMTAEERQRTRNSVRAIKAQHRQVLKAAP